LRVATAQGEHVRHVETGERNPLAAAGDDIRYRAIAGPVDGASASIRLRLLSVLFGFNWRKAV
jgi:hypothetical protein